METMKKEFSAINKRQRKVEAEAKATGFCKYAGDVYLSGTLYGKILRSPIAHGIIKSIDTSKAESLPGVVAVITGKDVPDNWVRHVTPIKWNRDIYDTHVLEKEKVRYIGDRVAAVAATSEEIAEKACSLIEVEYEELPAVFDLVEAVKDDAPIVHDYVYEGDEKYVPKNNCLKPLILNIGDAEKAFKESDFVFENEFKLSHMHHAMLERPCSTVRPLPNGGLEVWGCYQSVYGARESLSMIFGIPIGKINVHLSYLGGSFGSHIQSNFSEAICAALAIKTNAPVRLEHTREEMFQDFSRHPGFARLKMGVNKDGSIQGMNLYYLDGTGSYSTWGPYIMHLVAGWYMSMYKCPNISFEGYTAYTNLPPHSVMRGAGNPQQAFCVEQQVDMIAEKIGMDPMEFRLKNHIGLGDLFFGQGPDVICEVKSCGTDYLIEETRKRIGWDNGYKNITPYPDKPWIKRGIGFARGFHTSGCGTPKPSDLIIDWTAAIVKLNDDGTAVLISACSDHGAGNRSTNAAVVAEELGISYDKVIVPDVTTDTSLYDVVSHASRGNYCGGLAVQAAARSCKKMLLEYASRILDVPVSGLDVKDDKVVIVSMPRIPAGIEEERKVYEYYGTKYPLNDDGIDVKTVCEVARDANWGNPVGAESVRATSCPPHFISAGIVVDVDTETGEVEVVRAISGCDVGTPINISNVEGQSIGGMHMGLGYGLTEEIITDGKGRIMNPNYRDYRLLSAVDMPRVEIIMADTYEPTGPFGAKGMGEGAANSVAPAAANAVANAIGVHIKENPLTPERILRALGKLK